MLGGCPGRGLVFILWKARAGADVVSPNDMMDGRVGAMWVALDVEGFLICYIQQSNLVTWPCLFPYFTFWFCLHALEIIEDYINYTSFRNKFSKKKEIIWKLKSTIANSGHFFLLIWYKLTKFCIMKDLDLQSMAIYYRL